MNNIIIMPLELKARTPKKTYYRICKRCNKLHETSKFGTICSNCDKSQRSYYK